MPSARSSAKPSGRPARRALRRSILYITTGMANEPTCEGYHRQWRRHCKAASEHEEEYAAAHHDLLAAARDVTGSGGGQERSVLIAVHNLPVQRYTIFHTRQNNRSR